MPITIPIEIGDVIRVGRFKNKKITVKEIGSDQYGLPTVNGKGILKIRIEKLMPKKQEENMNKSFRIEINRLIEKIIKEEYPIGTIKKTFEFSPNKNAIKVKFKEENGRHWIVQEEFENILGSSAGYETKDTARQAALIKGFYFEGVEDMQGKVPEIPKPTPAERIKTETEEIKLGKEKELKMEILKIARKVIREEIQVRNKKKDLTEADVTDNPELEKDARRYAEIANKLKLMQEEMKKLTDEYEELDQQFRPLLEQVGTTKDTFIRAGKLLIKIERAGYDKTSASYKTGFEYLYNKVNGTMKELADEALAMTKTVSYVKSKIAVVQGESVLREENWFNKIKNFITNGWKKLFGLNKEANNELTKLEKMI